MARPRAQNLALRVADERYFYIEYLGPRIGVFQRNAVARSGNLIDLNTAFEHLTTLPGIGDVRAQLIIDYPEQNGHFKAVSDIVLVHGIGKATYEKYGIWSLIPKP